MGFRGFESPGFLESRVPGFRGVKLGQLRIRRVVNPASWLPVSICVLCRSCDQDSLVLFIFALVFCRFFPFADCQRNVAAIYAWIHIHSCGQVNRAIIKQASLRLNRWVSLNLMLKYNYCMAATFKSNEDFWAFLLIFIYLFYTFYPDARKLEFICLRQ